MKLAFSIATRFLKSSKGQTLLILIGITIGVAVQIFIGSLIDGLQNSLVERTIGSSSHVTISNQSNENYFSDYEDLMEELEQEERLTAVSKSFDGSGFLFQDEETFPVLMRGFEFEAANEIYSFPDKIVEGNVPENDAEVMIGTNLAEDMDVAVGDALEFSSPGGEIVEVEIVGIFDLRVASLNESWVVGELETVQSIFDEAGSISSIETQVKEVFEADVLASEIDQDIDSLGLETTNWKAQNEELLSGLTGQSISSYMIQVFVLVAVLLGIASVLAISVVQKSKQLGILKAMGIKDKTASQIFLFQGFILGTFGAVIGTGVGIGLNYAFSVFVKNPDGTSLVPFYLDWQFIAVSVVIAIVASTLAAFIPAKNSSKLNPIEVIKNG